MIVATLFAALVLLAGYGVVRLLGLAKGAGAIGLVPAAGLGLTAVVTTWCGMSGAPPPVAGMMFAVCSLVGIGLVIVDREPLGAAARELVLRHGTAAALFGASVLLPMISMGVAFAQVQAPLSPHDGAFHVETSDAFRHVMAVANWYPPGLAALFGAVLQLVPWLDSAAGGFELGMGLSLLAPIAAFGLGAVVWRNLVAAGAGALLLVLTHLFPYYPQIWSGWPQLIGILLVIGLWLIGLRYVEEPGWRWALLAGVILGAIVLVHGTELYTSSVVLVVVACAAWRRIPWPRLLPHGVLVVVVAVVCAAPYLPTLLHWAGGGGAYQVGFEDGSALEHGTESALQLLGLFTLDALGIDFPVRLVLVALGLVWLVRCRVGLSVVAVVLVFVGLAVIATLFNAVPLVRAVFAATYPWSLPYRHLTFASVGFALIGGYGCVLLVRLWEGLLQRLGSVRLRRVVMRLGRLLVVTWLLLSGWALTLLLGIEAGGDVSFTADDAAAMAWLSAHVAGSDVVVNDTFADAGIWAPYKAGVRILFYRSGSDDPARAAEKQLVLENISRLDLVPSAAAAACALHARYVYYGAANAGWQVRRFPPIEELRGSTASKTAFEEGKATVFTIVQPCQSM